MKDCRFCDLDNTLIFSHRHDVGEKMVVEYLDGKEQSYMQMHIYEMFCKTEKIIVPLTSRTCVQYERIELPVFPQYALLDNGGILLINGEKDEAWISDTFNLVSEDLEKMRCLQSELIQYGEIKWQDDLVIFLKLTNIEDSVVVKNIAEDNNLLFFEHGNKRYICSKKMNKGMAIKRFRDRFNVEKAFMAGDSLVDADTAPFVDVLYLPFELKSEIPDDANVTYVGKLELAERILRG